MRRSIGLLVVAGLLVGASPVLSASPPEIVINDDEADARYDCSGTYAGASVVINGSKNTVALTGTCNVLTINANHNKVSVETIASIVIKGRENSVTYEKAAKGATPKVTDLGKGNTVKKAKKDKKVK